MSRWTIPRHPFWLLIRTILYHVYYFFRVALWKQIKIQICNKSLAVYININKSISFYKERNTFKSDCTWTFPEISGHAKRKMMEICYENTSGWYVQNRKKLLMFEYFIYIQNNMQKQHQINIMSKRQCHCQIDNSSNFRSKHLDRYLKNSSQYFDFNQRNTT
jgi:hypothetical protein